MHKRFPFPEFHHLVGGALVFLKLRVAEELVDLLGQGMSLS